LLDCNERPFDIRMVFGEKSLPIHADWFSGRLEIDRGEPLSYHHMGWGFETTERLRLYVKDGRVVARRRYDQAKLLRRRFAKSMQSDPNCVRR
jgi:hypothetical protein